MTHPAPLPGAKTQAEKDYVWRLFAVIQTARQYVDAMRGRGHCNIHSARERLSEAVDNLDDATEDWEEGE